MGESRSLPDVNALQSLYDGSHSDESDRESFATENSDEEQLEGEPSEHVESMLRQLLDPDERQELPGSRVPSPEALRYSQVKEGSHEEGEVKEWEERIEAAEAAEADIPESEAEELEEAGAIAQHLHALKLGLHAWEEWDQALERDRTTPSPSESRSSNPPPIPAALRGKIDEMRELQRELRELASNQHALVLFHTQQLLRLSYAQTDLAERHHQTSRRRHKQLRIVRRESHRLCACIQELSEQVNEREQAM